MPEDGGWADIAGVPRDLREIVELHLMAMADGETIENVRRKLVRLEEVLDVFDGWSAGQQILVARDDEGHIGGMLSYYYTPDGVPFLESVAVDPDLQGNDIGGALIDSALDEVRRQHPLTTPLARPRRG